jgi:hypothetical protein
MDVTTAWDLFIAGFTDSGHARRHATRFRTGPLEAVRFAAGELSSIEFWQEDCARETARDLCNARWD